MSTRIVVTAMTDQGLEAPVSQHFGHAPYFAVIDVEDGKVAAVESMANPFATAHQPGQIPGYVHGLGANVILSGGMGGRAVAFFQQYGIEAATGACGTVGESLAQYLDGGFSGAAACEESVEHGHG